MITAREKLRQIRGGGGKSVSQRLITTDAVNPIFFEVEELEFVV